MSLFKPQKVLNLTDALKLKVPKVHGVYHITPKLDGWFVSIAYNKEKDSWEAPRSSSGRIIPAFEHTTKLFELLPTPKEDCILIAEATLDDTPFHILNGIFNRSVGNYRCDDVVFNFHDIVYPKFQAFSQTRRRCLVELASSFNYDYFRRIPMLYSGTYDHYVWNTIFEEVVSQGGEGVVGLRDDSLYQEGKRNADILKLKLELTVDCLAVALEESIGDKGEPSLTLVSRRKNGTLVRTVIGKHSDQDLFRSDANNIVGKVIEVKAMEELEDLQLRQPVFKCIREDKLPEDID